MGNLTTEHPTREEWAARQERMPAGFKAACDRYREKLDAERRAAEERENARQEEIVRRLADFELALAEVLAGNEWLIDYRERNPVELANACFGLDHVEWIAVFDLTSVGGWRLWVRLQALTRDGFQWHTKEYSTFTVKTPSHTVSFSCLDTALAYSARYVSTPF